MDHKKVYLPKNHFIREEAPGTEQFPDCFSPFKKLNLRKRGVETIQADAGIDIGFTLIGMHLKKVAVPVRLENNRIGEAMIIAARTRPKFIGGIQAIYDKNML